MKIVLAPKTIMGPDVHMVEGLKINMYLLCKISRVLVLGAPTLLQVGVFY